MYQNLSFSSKGFLLCLLFGACLFCAVPLFGAQVDTVITHSRAMNKNIKAVVILPDGYAEADSLPVVYILHGFGGNYANWITRVPELPALADRYQMILVCADGAKGSWYWDSPVDPSYRYETYVAEELPTWIDARYKTFKSRAGRAITGLSMGGHGALYLAFRHQDRFGAAGSTAGGVDFRPFPQKWQIEERLGPYKDFPERWTAYTVMGNLHLLTGNSLALIIDCGAEDFFYPVNEALHKELIHRNISHTYKTGPGKHEWPYWKNSIRAQLQFFHCYYLCKK